MTTYKHKIALVGDSEVGKSAWLKYIKTKKFQNHYIATSGYNIDEIKIKRGHINISLEIWDISGHQKDGHLLDFYLRDIDAAIVMCSYDSELSTINIGKWTRCILKNSPKVKIIVCTNKSDLEDNNHSLDDQIDDINIISVKKGLEVMKPLEGVIKSLGY